MTDNDPDVRTPGATAPGTPTAPAVRRRTGSVAGGLALILAVVALLSSAYLGYTLITRRGLYSASVSSGLEHLAEQETQTTQLVTALTQQVGTLRKNQNTQQAELARISSEFGKGRHEWLLAEAEQLLVIANHRLQLSHNVALALAALRAADQDLRQLADPRYLPVRRLLADEIGRLAALGRADVSGMALRLGDIARHINSLPLAAGRGAVAARPAAAPPARTSQFGSMWHDFLGLVSIRHTSGTGVPLVPPGDDYFLRQNLRLMLYGAQAALLQGDSPVFIDDLTTAHRWIADYYDSSAAPVQAVQDELGRMLKSPLHGRLPDISGSLELMRQIRRTGAYR